MLTVYQEKGEHPIDNRHLQLLRGLRRSLSHRIRLRRFRKLLHQGLDRTRRLTNPSSGTDLFTAYQDELTEYKASLGKAAEEESVLQLGYMRWPHMQLNNSIPL